MHLFDFRKIFFPDVKTEKGKSVQFPPSDFELEDHLPFSFEDLLNSNLESLPVELFKEIRNDVRCGNDVNPTEAQLLMNILNYKLKSKEIKQTPLLEDYLDPSKEDMIFEGVEYDE